MRRKSDLSKRVPPCATGSRCGLCLPGRTVALNVIRNLRNHPISHLDLGVCPAYLEEHQHTEPSTKVSRAIVNETASLPCPPNETTPV